MSDFQAPIRSIADTARWVAYFRARETQRPDAVFRDPYAERLAGKLGFDIANTLADGNKHEWGWVARTYLFDKFVLQEVEHGADLIINLAAGLDARPYRLELPANLRWVEVDLPEIVDYKEAVLANDRPRCTLERVRLDLSDLSARRRLFAEMNSRSNRLAVMTEGLLIYLTPDEVGSLASDLAIGTNFRSWIVDLISPGQLKLMQRTTGKQLSDVGAAFKFGPPEGPDFFAPYGWRPMDVQGFMKTAAQLNRLPQQLSGLLPEPQGRFGNFPWSGVCLLKRGEEWK